MVCQAQLTPNPPLGVPLVVPEESEQTHTPSGYLAGRLRERELLGTRP